MVNKLKCYKLHQLGKFMCRSRLHGIALFTFCRHVIYFMILHYSAQQDGLTFRLWYYLGQILFLLKFVSKRSAAFGDNFYYVDQKQWEIKPFALKTYADPIQEMVRKMLGRCFIFLICSLRIPRRHRCEKLCAKIATAT